MEKSNKSIDFQVEYAGEFSLDAKREYKNDGRFLRSIKNLNNLPPVCNELVSYLVIASLSLNHIYVLQYISYFS